MGKVAFLFAGQGAQHPGMCADLIESEPAAKAVFATADAVRPGTTEQCLSGTKEELAQTVNTQPCVFAADLAAARALAAHGVTPDVVAGFSLGEVAALTFAGAYTDEQGFELVCHRAELMADAAEKNPGAMRAVVKLDAAAVERLAAEAGESCWPVNYNSPLQTVVAGTPEACEKLDELVKAAKGRAMKVAVSGAFHSPFMAEAARGLAAYLANGHAPAEPTVPVLANRTGEAYPADEASRVELLSSQVANPVQWVRTLEAMAADGVDTFIEVGPGKTLTGLVKRTLEGVTALPCETVEQLEAVLAALSEKGE
ncbi:ACP S-malonyltransferase [Olsenella profusa]|uniref:Malonyl CoA-acyl carrier protein transacylase n=1 Tax=Olsenella profusa TaxID=138595 RepID=A0ABS2F360_9ACTN|nr:ACP S-malonyltransferase [Olsenella profusa]MBM6775434.1 ACP S-malonyltransferase [Olsenella profusa]